MDPYIGEIRIFAGTYAPAGWAFCDGAAQAISENEALFSLIGTTYGGDGQATFNLPDLRGRIPVHQGTGPGLTPRVLGEQAGTESVTLTVNQIPNHNHPFLATTNNGAQASPASTVAAQGPQIQLYIEDATDTNLAPAALAAAGGNQPHSNLQPYLAINYIISLFGIYPSQT
jgi:microcystin-dependent protein